MKKGKDGFYCKYIKRILDVVCAILALTLFCWLYGIVAILVRLKLGSPVVFKQQRPGKDEKIFTLYKFRTMTDERDENGDLLPDEVRLTKFGKKLRSTSLDEIPEVWNILKGDMSVVGPRPLLISYIPYYTERERLRGTVRPGLSGLAQVSGRNYLDWDYRLATDVKYVEHVSFLFDVLIVLKTVAVIFKKENIAENTNKAEGNLADIRSSLSMKAAE